MANILQRLQGVRILSLTNPFNGNPGEAFGAYITDMDYKAGFNGQASEVTMNLVHESSRLDKGRTFDDELNLQTLSTSLIQSRGVPNAYRIEIAGNRYEPMFLYSYDTNIETDSKTSSVVFKDYSLILDKIYVGLAFRQLDPDTFERLDDNHPAHHHNLSQEATISGEFKELCPSCGLDNNMIFLKSYEVEREIKMSSCFFNNSNSSLHGNVFSYPVRGGKTKPPWRDVIKSFFTRADSAASKITYLQPHLVGTVYPRRDEISINGGALYLGTEQFKKEQCGGTTVVDYSFSELLASLVLNGLIIRNIRFYKDPNSLTYQAWYHGDEGSFAIDRNPRYRQNYTGTLKEVLSNWCSDLGLNYHFFSTELVFTDSSVSKLALDSEVRKIFDDPYFREGNPFVVNSYKSSASIDGTYVQGLITSHVKAQEIKEVSKSVNYQVGFLPLHPVALYVVNTGAQIRTTIFGEPYFGPSFIDPADTATSATREWFTQRLVGDVDASMAIGRYSSTLRNIYCGERYIQTKDTSHLAALGFFPLQEFSGKELKTEIIKTYMPGGTEDNEQNIVLKEEFFKVLIGYYYPTINSETETWEQNMSEAMYNYGVLVRGTQSGFPHVAENSNTQLHNAAGLLTYFRLTKDFDPSAERYYKRKKTPFKDAIPLSGFTLDTGYYIASLDNHWGTNKEKFNKVLLELSSGTDCNKYFGKKLYEQANLDDYKPQDWSLEDYEPKFFSDLNAIGDEIEASLEAALFNNTQNNAGTAAFADAEEITDLQKTSDLSLLAECKKLHICIIPMTKTHPNIRIDFTNSIDQPGRPLMINPIMLEDSIEKQDAETKRRAMEAPQTLCDLSLKILTCESGVIDKKINLINGSWDTNKPYIDQMINPDRLQYFEYAERGVCAPEPSRNDRYWNGFPKRLYAQNNSRYLTIDITRNPSGELQLDRDGDGYNQLSDYMDQLAIPGVKITAQPFVIIYPISRESNGSEIYYSGILSADMSTKTKFPDRTDIYGTETVFDPADAGFGYASIKMVNQGLDSDLEATIDPMTREYYPRIYDLSNNEVTSISQFHQLSKSAVRNVLVPMETISIRFGGAALPPHINRVMNSLHGLSSFSLKVGDNGEFLEVTFQSRPSESPKQEAILNKIWHRVL